MDPTSFFSLILDVYWLPMCNCLRCSDKRMKLESESNAIDRAIMNLLFEKLNYGPQNFDV